MTCHHPVEVTDQAVKAAARVLYERQDWVRMTAPWVHLPADTHARWEREARDLLNDLRRHGIIAMMVLEAL